MHWAAWKPEALFLRRLRLRSTRAWLDLHCVLLSNLFLVCASMSTTPIFRSTQSRSAEARPVLVRHGDTIVVALMVSCIAGRGGVCPGF